jgi:hypothetical protein
VYLCVSNASGRQAMGKQDLGEGPGSGTAWIHTVKVEHITQSMKRLARASSSQHGAHFRGDVAAAASEPARAHF